MNYRLGFAQQVRALTPAQRLLMAAELLERGKPEIAESIAQSALDELAWRRLFPGRPLPDPAERG